MPGEIISRLNCMRLSGPANISSWLFLNFFQKAGDELHLRGHSTEVHRLWYFIHINRQDSKNGKKKKKILGPSPDYEIFKSLAMKFMLQMAKDSALKANI